MKKIMITYFLWKDKKMSLQIELLAITIMLAITLSIPGSIIMLKQMSLLVFGLTHSLLFGIVVTFLYITPDFSSPLFILGATVTGILVIILIEFSRRFEYVNEDAALGIVYLFIFSLGLLLIAREASNVPELSIRRILAGQLVFSIEPRFYINGYDMGPLYFWILLVLFILNVSFILLSFKELQIIAFDANFASIIGIASNFYNYLFMGLVSVTIVGAFKGAGTVLVLALIILPSTISYLLVNKLSHMIILSSIVAIIASIIGFFISWQFNLHIAGTITIILAIIFILALLFTHKRKSIFNFNHKNNIEITSGV